MSPTTLKRRFRGYDREQTDRLLAELSTMYDELRAERDTLSTTLDELRREQKERALRTDSDLDELTRELNGREKQVSDQERQIRKLKREQEQQVEETRRLDEELLQARIAQERHDVEAADQQATLERFEVRERALLEQLVILKDELQYGASDGNALRSAENGATARLLKLDRLVESVGRQARREAELTLKKARAQAEKIVRAAESRGRELDPAPAPPADRLSVEDLQRHLGEALWTLRGPFDHPPE